MIFGSDLIHRERIDQMAVNGYDADHDAEHTESELARAAACYLALANGNVHPRYRSVGAPPPTWPWRAEDWHPSIDPIKNLVRAGALIAAEIDRLQRIEV